MHSFHYFILQASTADQSYFTLQIGLLVLLLSIFIVFQAVFMRIKKNQLMMEREMLIENFDKQLLINKVEAHEEAFDILGKELHDNINQLLGTAKMMIGITERGLKSAPGSLLSAGETLDKAILELRNISKSLNKQWVEKFDLKENLHSLVSTHNAAGKINFQLSYDNAMWLSSPQQFLLFRLLQEAVTNILNHASATEVSITVSCVKNSIKLLIIDNGKGFDTSQKSKGVGINNMVQRAKALGAGIEWSSGQSGTTVLVTIIKKNQS